MRLSATGSRGEANLRRWAGNDAGAERRLEVTSAELPWLRLARRDAPLIMKCKAMQAAVTAASIDATVTNRVLPR